MSHAFLNWQKISKNIIRKVFSNVLRHLKQKSVFVSFKNGVLKGENFFEMRHIGL
jgi:hypothetical protein